MSAFNRNECVKVMRRIATRIKDNVSGTIYHYTKAKGFEGIVKSNEIWMTNSLFVNDKEELRAPFRGAEIFGDHQFINTDFNIFKTDLPQRRPEEIEDDYLASFSRDGNSLGQFRAYGNYSIGFDAKKLKKNRFGLYECVYEEAKIKRWLITKDKLTDWQNTCFNNENGQSYKRSAFWVLKSAREAKSKNRHYKAEQEIRLLAVSNASWDWYTKSPGMFCDQPAIYFRDDEFFRVPVPYVKFFIPKKQRSFKELEEIVKRKNRIETKQLIKIIETEERELLPISEVRIGPMQHQEEAMYSARIFLLENGYDNVDVIPSDIPFRGH